MHILMTTRFNNKTWKENQNWRHLNNFNGCIYGTPKLVSDKYTKDCPLIVLEMNNDENRIEGIGLVKNCYTRKKHNIYSDYTFNRYIYKGKYRIDRDVLDDREEIVLEVLDALVFKGERHLKRGNGFIAVPTLIVNNKHINFIKNIINMFKRRKNLINNNESNIHE